MAGRGWTHWLLCGLTLTVIMAVAVEMEWFFVVGALVPISMIVGAIGEMHDWWAS